MGFTQKGVTPEQLQQVAKDLNLTVAAIADGAGLSKAYISEFRSKARNFSASQQAQLRVYLEAQCEAHGQDFPEDDGSASGQQLVQGLGGMIQRITRPAILLSDDIPKAQVDQLTNLIDANRLKVTDLLDQEFQPGGLLGGGFSPETEDAIRQTFALLALNYIAILMLQGRNIVRKLPDDYVPQTMGDWLSQYLAASPLAQLLPDDEKTVPTSEEVAA
jgi:transcriptional regulator with XRE-family HTH domain